jgi:hypothetical protein
MDKGLHLAFVRATNPNPWKKTMKDKADPQITEEVTALGK